MNHLQTGAYAVSTLFLIRCEQEAEHDHPRERADHRVSVDP
jgi:hypothetical protein